MQEINSILELSEKGAEDQLGKRALSMSDTSQISLSGDGPRSCMDSTSDWQLTGGRFSVGRV